MNRKKYFDSIESKLNLLAFRLESRGRLNILDLHLHSENFYLHFFNVLFDWNLRNLNASQQNAHGVDLVDETRKIIAQVSATATKQKVESALAKDLSEYQGYAFKFISISKDAKSLRTKSYCNPHNLIFCPSQDIHDIPSLLAFINAMDIDRLKEVDEFLKKELHPEPDPKKVESNLTAIIKILAEEDWNSNVSDIEIVPFDIEEKIEGNRLEEARNLIDDYKIHYFRIDKIYKNFDIQGVNKSLSVLNGIRTEYLALGSSGSPYQRFYLIIEKVVEKILNETPKEKLFECPEREDCHLLKN